jgi:hypothetical protein
LSQRYKFIIHDSFNTIRNYQISFNQVKQSTITVLVGYEVFTVVSMNVSEVLAASIIREMSPDDGGSKDL